MKTFAELPHNPALGTITLIALCHDCKHQHYVTAGPQSVAAQFMEWNCKHPGHNVEFLSPRRILPRGLDQRLSRMREEIRRAFPDIHGEDQGILGNDRLPAFSLLQDYRHNANIKIAYAASANFTITLASLASDTNLLAGRQSTSIDNTTNLYLDYQLSGFATTGTTPTAGQIEFWVYAPIDDTPTWPDQITGTDGNVTLTSVTSGSNGTLSIKQQGLAFATALATGTGSNVKYSMAAQSIAALYGGICPSKFGVFVVHNTVAALNSTSGNHQVTYKPVYATAT